MSKSGNIPLNPKESLDEVIRKSSFVNSATNESFLDPKLVKYLSNKGYTLLDEIGKSDGSNEGQTSRIFLASYKTGDIKKLRVVKIPTFKVDTDSICTLVNMSRKNIYAAEAHMSNLLSHDNIVDILDHYNYKGLDIIVEQYFDDAKSLSSSLNWSRLNHEDFIGIFDQLLSGTEYLHNQGIVHRDLKSSNVLLTKNKRVKIIDLQNCVTLNESSGKYLPSRGGASYSSPSVLNAWMTDSPAHNSGKGTDIYSLGIMMYESLTGKVPIEYSMKISDEGKPVVINGKTHFTKLFKNDVSIDSIDIDKHNAEIKKALKNVPAKYRKVIGRCLALDYNQYGSITQAREDFDKLKGKTIHDFVDKVYSSVKPALIGFGAALAFGALIYLGSTRDTEYKPTLKDMVTQERMSELNLSNYDSDFMWSCLHDQISNVKNNVSKVPFDKYYSQTIQSFGNLTYGEHGLPPRIFNSWLRACLLSDSADMIKTYSGKREWPILLPENFGIIRQNGETLPFMYTPGHATSPVNEAAFYLKLSMKGSTDIADVFASYFCSDAEIKNAMANTNSVTYLPSVGEDSSISDGYGYWLDSEKKSIINTALLLYNITDDEGNVHLDRVPKLYPNMGSDRDYMQYKIVGNFPPDTSRVRK